jgi:UV DNA damage endonuclease
VFSLAEFNRDILDNDEQISLLLAKLGSAFMTAGIRVTTHPDQFVVLSSDNPNTVNNAIKELSHHAWVFDKMGLPVSPFAAINIHGGKSDQLDQLVKAIGYLPNNVRSRLTLENDESAYSIVDLLPAYELTGVPIVWDSHHHTFNDGGLYLDDAYGLAKLINPENTPKFFGSFRDQVMYKVGEYRWLPKKTAQEYCASGITTRYQI